MEPIAIIGWCGQFPGAPDVDALWALIRDGRCALRSPWEGAPPRGLLDEPWAFAPERFGLTAREAALLDPQQRLFLEVALGALEHASYGDPAARPRTGLFGSLSPSPLRDQLLRRNVPLEPFELDGTLGDLAAGRAAWLLGLEGPCVMVQTACSSSLVALHLAVQSLLSAEVDLAVVAAASVAVLTPGEDTPVEGGTRARDGRCRPFDADATGTLGGDAALALVLQRASDARAARPLALILGTAALNDGARRASFTAPSAAGQAATLREALHVAGLDPAALGYIEAHGSGTPLGDAVEIEGLRAALGDLPAPLPLGALKANIGHTDAAAGLCGLLKAALCLHHAWLPATPGLQTPHPALRGAPLRVLSQGAPWPDGPRPRAAAVNAFGMGGANAAAVLQAAPPPEPHKPSPPLDFLALSADDAPSLALWTCLAQERLEAASPEEASDIAYTISAGREARRWRAAVVGRGRDGLLAALRAREARPVLAAPLGPVTFLCEGAARFAPAEVEALLRWGDPSRARWEECAAACAGWLALDEALGDAAQAQGVDSPLWHAAQVSAQLALAAQWASVGLRPARLVGHSLGQWAAAILAGVFSLRDGLALVIRRAALLEALPQAALLAIPASAAEVAAWGLEGAAVAIAHSDRQCALSCELASLPAVEAALRARGLPWRALEGARPVHTAAAREAAQALRGLVAATARRAPEAPLLCNATGRWMTAAQALDPDTWAAHLEAPARLDLAWPALWAAPLGALVSLGTDRALAQQAALEARRAGLDLPALPSLSRADGDAMERWLRQVGALWTRGAALRLEGLWPAREARRVPLPPTPCARRRFDPAALWSASAPPRPALTPASPPAPPAQAPAPRLAALIEVWERAFGVAPIGPDEDFYALGGHSLLALQLISRLRRAHGVELPLRLLFAHPTPRAMAQAWARWEQEAAPAPPPDGWREAPDPAAALTPWLARLMARLDPAQGQAPLLWALEAALQLPLYAHEVAGLDTPAALAALLAQAARPAPSDHRSKPPDHRSKPSDHRSEARPAAAFVLSSARSGSTLLRVMLAGHPALFAPPELHLWMYRDLEERAARLPSAHFGQGLPRALQELRGGTFAQAQAEADQWRREGLTIAQADARLRALCAPRRLVDKSPSYAESTETLAALSAAHPEAALIHLVRHPLAVMESYVRRRMGAMSRGDARDPWAQAEAHWATCQRNLLWLERRHPGRWLRVYYEDLVTDPERWLRRVCGHLGVGFDAATLTPYQGRRMIDGIGDPGLHERDALDPALASAWRGVRPPRALQPDAAALALTLGYDWEEP